MREICSYFNCRRSKRSSPTLRRFAFPINNPDRCQQWLLNVGNADLLTLNPQTLQKYFICENHFRKEHLLTKKLIKSAVPISYLETSQIGCVSIKQFSPLPTTEPTASTSNSADNEEVVYLTPPKEQSASEVLDLDKDESPLVDISNLPTPNRLKFSATDATVHLKKRLKSTEAQVFGLKRKLKINSGFSIPRRLDKLPTVPRALTRMQLYHTKRSPWLSDEKSTALSIFCKSPSTYKYLRSKGMILPSPSTIHKWLSEQTCRPGLNKRLLKFLKLEID